MTDEDEEDDWEEPYSDSNSPIVTGKCTNNITEGCKRGQPIPERLVADAIASRTNGWHCWS